MIFSGFLDRDVLSMGCILRTLCVCVNNYFNHGLRIPEVMNARWNDPVALPVVAVVDPCACRFKRADGCGLGMKVVRKCGLHAPETRPDYILAMWEEFRNPGMIPR